ncbi:hypothetical protein [Treponema sp. R80B11-R83G3]
MKKIIPVISFVFVVVCSSLIIVYIIYPHGKSIIKENGIVQANNEVNDFLDKELDSERLARLAQIGESNFDDIIAYIEADAERQHFLGVTLIRLSDYESNYALDFESRYPRYKAYRDMVNELSRKDYSEWVGSIIKGTVKIEFEANVFDYLSGLDDRRYINDAISRFIAILNNSSSGGFSAQTNKDAFIIGALSLYIMQFPGNNTVLRNALGEKADQFISLSENNLNDIHGIPLNQVYIYLFLKYFGLENIINKKMNEFISSGKISLNKTGKWDGRTWSMKAVDSLVNYFSTTGKGMSQNFYSLIQSGFDKNQSERIYVALRVLKNIGFDDPAPSFRNLLDRASRRESDLQITTTEIINGMRGRTTTNPIIFSEEVAEVRREIAGKTDVPFEAMLNSSLKTSSETGKFITPRVTAVEVVNKEVSAMSGQYTKDFIVNTVKTWEVKNKNLANMRFVEIIFALLACLVVLIKFSKKDNSNIVKSQIVPYSSAAALSLLTAFVINSIIATL